MNVRNLLGGMAAFFCMAAAGMAQNAVNGDSLTKAFFADSVSQGYSRDDFAQSLENAYQLLNGAQKEAVLGWTVLEAKQQLGSNRKITRLLRKVLKSHTNSGFRDLQLYGNMLDDLAESNTRIREVLKDAERELEESQRKIRGIAADSVIRYLIAREAADTTGKHSGLDRLKYEYSTTNRLIKTGLDSLQRWNAMAAFQAMNTAEMIRKTDSIMQQTSLRAFKGDCVHLWMASDRVNGVDTTAKKLVADAKGNNEIINYYIEKNIGRILWMPVLIFIVFFRWLRKNYKRVKAAGPIAGSEEALRLVRRGPLLGALVVSLSFFPLMDIHAPWAYQLLGQCVLMGITAYYFWNPRTRGIVPVWLGLFLLLLGLSVVNSFEPDLWQRWALLIINLLSVVTVLFLFRRIRHVPRFQKTVRMVAYAHIVLTVLAMLANVFGRMIIAEALSNAALVGIIHIISLSVFMEAIGEGLYLQLIASRLKRGIPTGDDHETILKALRKPIYLFVLLVWGVMFAANLYMYEMIRTGIVALLKAPVVLGSLSFSLGNVLLFFLIIWIAHLLQMYIGSFFGDTDNDDDLESKKQRSRMMVIKLLVICVGYLLAVAASGLPLDKITIVLGALGVGVGMGLQNIVNNFVSGVVLIFDRPLQIGDSIEVGDNKGRVKSIGIRSSTLLTPDGAEVIIPNGDLLSSPITNWTLSNNQRRVELEFTLQTSENKDVLLGLIKSTLATAPGVVQEREPAISVEDVKDGTVTLKIYFWCNNINKSDWIKSEVRYLLYGAFREKGIVVV